MAANFHELYAANANRAAPRPRKQIVAIVMRKAGTKRPAHMMDHYRKK